ncbi:uncharacterized protein PAC_15862 [Phialocephala subalpina]|uniref:Uncharacterized protein n=1 Tax=Phialocephala subalpina TaxID=576137 RepID=A0A1L7XLP5_9HELO|nr:uncharacterized protein PAC_15862 [Phialocephala subalpina]
MSSVTYGYIATLKSQRASLSSVSQYLSSVREILETSRLLYPTKAFAVATSPPLVILPITMIDEVKNLPETRVSAARELFRRAAGHYSKMGTNSVAAIKALRIDLNRKSTTIPTLVEETTTLSRRRWRSTMTGRRLRYPTWIRDYITPYFSETKKVLEQRKRAKKFPGPSFEEQLHAKRKGPAPPSDEEWMKKYLTTRPMQVESLVRHQLGISWASAHMSTHALTQIIYGLAARPEYQEPLRDELEHVLAECDGELTRVDLSRLRKMESFMKESLRLNPITVGPEIFNGYRFFNTRQMEGEENKQQFGATGPTETFDFGHHTLYHCCGTYL